MFEPVFDFGPSIYETIIAAFVVIGLFQAATIRRASRRIESLKKNVTAVVGIVKLIGFSTALEVARLTGKLRAANIRADQAQRRASRFRKKYFHRAIRNSLRTDTGVLADFFAGGRPVGRHPALGWPYGRALREALLTDGGVPVVRTAELRRSAGPFSIADLERALTDVPDFKSYKDIEARILAHTLPGSGGGGVAPDDGDGGTLLRGEPSERQTATETKHDIGDGNYTGPARSLYHRGGRVEREGFHGGAHSGPLGFDG